MTPPFPLASPPAFWVGITTARRNNFLYVGDALTFTLSQAGAQTYTVRDYWGTTVASGSVSGTSLTITAQPVGWYRLYLDRSTVDATFGTACGDTCFAVLPVDARFPVVATSVAVPASMGSDYDWALLGMTGMGPGRILVDPTLLSANTVTEIGLAKTYWSANGLLDAARPRALFASFNPVITGHEANAQTAAATYYPDVTWFEGPYNEPTDSAATLVTLMSAFNTNIKTGAAAAKVLGPCLVAVNGQKIDTFDTFLAAGGGTSCDGFSIHFYNGMNGDLNLGRRTLDLLKATLTKYGQQAKPIFVTEHGFNNGACVGVFQPRTQASWGMQQYLLFEQYGIPKEQFAWYYSYSHGFWTFPSWVLSGDGSPYPLPVMLRTYSAEIYGKTFTRKLAFGTHGDIQYLGNLYTDGSTGTQVVAVMASGRTDAQLTFTVSGSTVTQVSCFGVTSTLTVNAGTVTVNVGKEPVYLRLAAGQTIAEPTFDYGRNKAGGSRYTTVATGNLANSIGTPAGVANNLLENDNYSGSTASFLTGQYALAQFTADATFPATVTVTMPNWEAVNRVLIIAAAPWSRHSSLTDFDVQWWDGAAWQTAATITEPASSFARASTTQGPGGTAETFYSDRWMFEATFANVRTNKIRLNIRGATLGGTVDAGAQAAGGQGWGSAQVTLQEVYVFGPTTAPAATQGVRSVATEIVT